MALILNILASSSSGNGYIIQSEDEAIILEAGVHPSKVKEALSFNTKKVKGCFVTHVHGDHSKYISLYERTFQVYANRHVIETKKLSQTTEAMAGKGIRAGNFKVLPFNAFHDVPTLGYYIHHPDMGYLLFLTDSFMLDTKFKEVNHFLVECNYSDAALDEAIKNGSTNPAMRKRLMTTHMELKTVSKFLLLHDLTTVYNIVLIHLSKFNSDRKEFVDTLEKATGKNIMIADPGMKIELTNNPY
jgi:phosphoribosyl 1,2-cyclic phosphodiesterase